MSKMVQLRNVPDDIHRILKSRAAINGMSLSDYLIAEITRVAQKPTPEEIAQRLANRSPVQMKLSPAKMIRQERDKSDRR